MKKIIIFDLDGTLYQFKEGSFKESGIYYEILENTKKYIAQILNKTKEEADGILMEVIGEYGDSISIGLEKEFKINRYEYFNNVWDIAPKKYIEVNDELKDIFFRINKNFDFILLSDAPNIWIKRVLNELQIEKFFHKGIFSGEGNIRKEFKNAFSEIEKMDSIGAKNFISIGDQEETDIIPAKKAGMKTIFVNKKLKSSIADYTVKDVLEIEKPLEFLNQIN